MFSLVICLFLIFETYKKWVRSPVIVSFATKQTPIWQIPFPAITICPETKAKATTYNITQKYYEFIDGVENATAIKTLTKSAKIAQDERFKFEIMSLICPIYYGKIQKNFKVSFVNEAAIHFMKEVSPKMSDIFWSCEWLGNPTGCDELFSPLLTDEGICFTFNMLNRSELYKSEMLVDFNQHF